MNPQPTLQTKRLILRPFKISDAPRVQHLAGDRAVALQTKNIPYPYEDGLAEQWLSTLAEQYADGKRASFAILLRKDHQPQKELIGDVSLTIVQEQEKAELGYWIGKPYWGNGYCGEAARAILGYGFVEIGLRRIEGQHYSGNPASGRVMQKIGMTHEGHLRQHTTRMGQIHDIEIYGILRDEYVPVGDYSIHPVAP